MRILGRANCCNEFRKVPAMNVWLRIEKTYGGSVPGPRHKTAGPKSSLEHAPSWYEGQDVKYNLVGEEYLVVGWFAIGCWYWRSRHRARLARSNGYLERLRH